MADKDPLDGDWADIAGDWQRQPTKKVDTTRLLKKIRRRILVAKGILVADVVATLGLFSVFIYTWFSEGWSRTEQIFLGFVTLGSIVYVYYEYQARKGTWQVNVPGSDSVLQQAIKGCESSLKFLRVMKLYTWLLLPLANWFAYSMAELRDKPAWKALLFVNLVCLAMLAVTIWYEKRRQKELASLLASDTEHP